MDRYSTARHTTDVNIIWRTRFASRITKATDTRAACLVLLAFPPQQCLSERAATLCFTYEYIACLVLSATSPETVKSVVLRIPRVPRILCSGTILYCVSVFSCYCFLLFMPGTYKACFPTRKENPEQLSRYSDLDYGPDGLGFVSWQGQNLIFFQNVLTGSGVHPASYLMGTGFLSRG